MHFHFLTASSLRIKMKRSAMDTPVIKVKGHQWRISMKQGYQKLMVRWLPFLVFMMVCFIYVVTVNISYSAHEPSSDSTFVCFFFLVDFVSSFEFLKAMRAIVTRRGMANMICESFAKECTWLHSLRPPFPFCTN